MINFHFMPKIIRVLGKDQIPLRHFVYLALINVNISKLNF